MNFSVFSRNVMLFLFLSSFNLIAQDAAKHKGYIFKTESEVKVTPVKNQFRSGTCWSFCTVSFLESEILRLGGPEYDLSEMWSVRHSYEDKAARYVRMHGKMNFGGGGATNDVTDVFRKYGYVPEQAYGGLTIGEDKHVHGEMDHVLKEYIDGVVENKNRKLTPVWDKGLDGILDAYLGVKPESFEFEGETYTPESFAASLPININDYVLISSFTHHPFYEQFIMEVPDNWSWGMMYNLPLDEMMEVMVHSLEEGYSISWASDVSEKGFSWTNGIAIVPDAEKPDLSGTERERWEKLTDSEKASELYSFDEPVAEKSISQEMRQEAFDNYSTTDDHGMHITGLAVDQEGTRFFKVKNSWGTSNPFDGYLYASDAFVRYKTISIMVHKDAIPKNIRQKLAL
ncbi:MAG: aminopeptidase C [Bacteroidota bacterium]